MKKFYLTLSVCLFLLLLLPAIQLSSRVFPTCGALGMGKSKKFPLMSAEAFESGKFQEKLETWLIRKNGFFGSMVRFSNELNLRLFNQISTSYRPSVQIGEKGYFFRPVYLGSFNHTDGVTEEKATWLVRNLKILQDLLGQRGIQFVFLISTSQMAVYPELVPEQYVDPTRSSRANGYQVVRPLLDRFGVNYVDGHEILIDVRDTTPYPLFVPTGSHWSDYGGCLVTQRLVSKLEGLTGKKMRPVPCEPVKVREPRDYDRDLVEIANLWNEERTYQPGPYVIFPEKIGKDEAFRPNLLFEGTSFMWSVLRFLESYRVPRTNTFLFYFNRIREWPKGVFKAFKRDELDWDRRVLSQDAVIIEINSAVITTAGNSFIEEAIKKLGGEPV